MEPIDTTNDEPTEIDADDGDSVDEFIRQLEEKEKDLDISADLVIEFSESEVEHENIHDSFVPQNTSEFPYPDLKASKQAEPPAVPSDEKEKAELERLSHERDEIRDSLQRQKRDFDNYRMRTERERQEMYKGILGNLANKILPVLDNLNRALDATGESDAESKETDTKVFFEGIVLVNQQLNEVLAGMGVVPIPAVGEPFDPNFHEAVATEATSDHPPQTVTQELLRGYRIDDKVIRASMVKVSAAPDSNKSGEPTESSTDESQSSQKDPK